MALNKREKYIAIGVGAAVGIFLLNYTAEAYYLDPKAETVSETAKAVQALSDGNDALQTRKHLQPIWNDLQSTGLKLDEQTAENQVLKALNQWEGQAGVNVDNQHQDHTSIDPDHKEFEVIAFSLEATGTTNAFTKLLWAIETSPIPMRVNSIAITSPKQGTDNLKMNLSVSSLCGSPTAAPVPSAAPATAPANMSTGGAS